MRDDFSVVCSNCNGEVNGWTQTENYILSHQGGTPLSQSIKLSCGCVIDFPDWQVDLKTGWCQIFSATGELFIEFLDTEAILIDEDDED
jgi:hypothetical protein